MAFMRMTIKVINATTNVIAANTTMNNVNVSINGITHFQMGLAAMMRPASTACAIILHETRVGKRMFFMRVLENNLFYNLINNHSR